MVNSLNSHHVVLEDSITVQDLAGQLGKKATDVIMKLMTMGVMATINQELDVDTATIIAEEFGATVEVKVSKNASWPGVSRNVIFCPWVSTWYAPICCVIPPASVEVT